MISKVELNDFFFISELFLKRYKFIVRKSITSGVFKIFKVVKLFDR